MTEAPNQEQPIANFTWHPTYVGQSEDRVRRGLREEIGRDQRQYALSLEGAEAAEHDSLASVVELERRWGQFDFDWAETDPDALADRIVDFELERDQRRELIGYAAWRAEQADTGEEITPELAWKTAPVLIGAVALIVIIVIILAIVQ